MPYLLQFDGASEPNPGPSGSAYVLFSPIKLNTDGEQIRTLLQEGYMYIPRATNNEAEYTALRLGLRKALDVGIQEIEIEGDSNLVVQQVQGKWKIKEERLLRLKNEISQLLLQFKSWSINHIPRNENGDADALSKEAILMKKEDHRCGSYGLN